MRLGAAASREGGFPSKCAAVRISRPCRVLALTVGQYRNQVTGSIRGDDVWEAYPVAFLGLYSRSMTGTWRNLKDDTGKCNYDCIERSVNMVFDGADVASSPASKTER